MVKHRRKEPTKTQEENNMNKITIGGKQYEIDWSMGLEDLCEDCYDRDRKNFVGQIGNMRVYELYAHSECYLIERYYKDTESYTEGIAGTPTTCDYEAVDE